MVSVERLQNRIRSELTDRELINEVIESIEDIIDDLSRSTFSSVDEMLYWFFEEVIWSLRQLPDSFDKYKLIHIVRDEYSKYLTII